MFSHVFIGVANFEQALSFYRELMRGLGIEEKFCDFSRPWAGWHCAGGTRPLLIIGKPYNQQPHQSGNGQMVAFLSPSRAIVRNSHELALSYGCKSEGEPGLRPEYHTNYYGAYFRDPDGNKLCVVCHDPET